MSVQMYIKGSKRGEFQWECIESGENGFGNSVDVEETMLKGRVAKIRRCDVNEFEAEVDNLKSDLCYDEKTFSSRLNARKWCERLISEDIKNFG